MHRTEGETAASAEIDVEIGDSCFGRMEDLVNTGQGGQVLSEAEETGPPQLEERVSNDSVESKGRLGIYRAATRGDWKAAMEIYTSCKLDFDAPITTRGETALHVAALAEQAGFLTELVQVMSDDGLNRQDCDGCTAFCFAVVTGLRALTEPMINRNNDLAVVRRADGMLPLYVAVICGQVDMVSYLYGLTRYRLEDKDCTNLLVALIDADMYDIALDMVKEGRTWLATTKDINEETAMHALGRKSHFVTNRSSQVLASAGQRIISNPFSCFSSNKIQGNIQHESAHQLAERIWEEVAILSDEKISNLLGNDWRPIFMAAQQGNVEFLQILLRIRPGIVTKSNEQKLTIFHIAIKRRHEKIFKLIYEIASFKNLITRYRDKDNNNMLHLAGMLAPPHKLNVVPGAALQLQRELMWFAEVKKVVGSGLAKARNKFMMTPEEVFMEEHQDLLKKGEKWMTTTANSCMFVATLVATVAFAAAFTVPGGNDQNTGYPMFVNKTLFKIFAVSDAISLIFSVSSVLTFLSILTSTYALEDFVRSLPAKLLVGLFTLFVSISAMMVAFVSVFFVYFRNHELPRYALPVAVVAFAPICLFIWLHSQLFGSLISSNYMTRFSSPSRPNYRDPVFPAAKTFKKA